jgi:hypothetical protein
MSLLWNDLHGDGAKRESTLTAPAPTASRLVDPQLLGDRKPSVWSGGLVVLHRILEELAFGFCFQLLLPLVLTQGGEMQRRQVSLGRTPASPADAIRMNQTHQYAVRRE